MSLTQLKVTLPYVTGLPEDVACNTWYFDGALGPVGILGDATPRIADFYQGLNGFWSAYLQAECLIQAYDMTEPSPRAPVGETTFTIAPGAGSSLPLEVSLCLSYKATHTSGEPVARERGRLYIGPFDDAALATGEPASRPNETLMLNMAIGGRGIIDTNTTDSTWVVYSPTSGGGREITSGWVDNAWDTQRRRGSKPTERMIYSNTFPVP